LLDGLAMYFSCDTKKFHDNESTPILHNFWTSTHSGGMLPPLPPLAAPLKRVYMWYDLCIYLHLMSFFRANLV